MGRHIVKRLKENKHGRDFVVGDIHGCFFLLEQALEAANFDPKKDRVISVGDLVDRGPESERALSFLQKSWFYAVKGNHDEEAVLFTEALEANALSKSEMAEWRRTFQSDWLFKKENRALFPKIREAFNKLPYAIEIETSKGIIGFVHAEIPKEMNWSTYKKALRQSVKNDPLDDYETIRNQVLWGRDRIRKMSDEDKGVAGIYRLFVGHTPQRKITKIGNIFYVDTAACYTQGHLSVVNIF